ncbi:MlaA family lipoprotein [Photobacterium sp. ZSDE20]|uniref:MlaA family lipoprotein n=1 Tax=Photobacterium pectinilyticum TaxID=2906793 RepID=A0ABT1N0S3_9GAMM|nr:MlaA family lipoprotein [Photobacterium sp. ZSDE20]MCQ1058338.1 MlaA family lipoprotein [Photobacterium sp. ZSDE20]MDD1823133.1 MlaA family lipoprotein [Photobacterium sp. ZSDE20]
MKKHLFTLAILLTLTACAQSPDEQYPEDLTSSGQASSDLTASEMSPVEATSDEQASSAPSNIESPASENAMADDSAMDEFGDYDANYDEDLAAVLEEVEQGEGEYAVPGVYDPFEGFNRAMWDLNYDYLDPYLVRPVSLAYVDYTPSFIRTGIKNFLANLDEPASMVNSALMLNGEETVRHFNRFWINSTFGVFGLIDIASAADIRKPVDKQFGDTMGKYGVANGPYFMFPVYGPLTLREGAGDVVDGLYLPLSALSFWQSLGKWAFEGMEDRAALVKQEAILKDSPDSYIFTRDAYIQNKNFRATGGNDEMLELEDEAYLDDFLDEIDGL